MAVSFKTLFFIASFNLEGKISSTTQQKQFWGGKKHTDLTQLLNSSYFKWFSRISQQNCLANPMFLKHLNVNAYHRTNRPSQTYKPHPPHSYI